METIDFKHCAADQAACSLFTIPPELRHRIFDLALSPALSTDVRYPRACIWNRPGHSGPLTRSTTLLRTCQRIFNEAAHLLYDTTSLTFYLTSLDRRPYRATNPYTVQKWKVQRRVNTNLEVFAQLYLLEELAPLQDILDIETLDIRTVSITIRHTDWWWWEDDHPLRMSGSWAQHLEFPNTVDTITLHLETTMRAKRELEYIADGMTQWKFRRLDDKRLNWLGKERGMKQSTWSGPSTITSQRWLRDEARPGEIDYCVLSLTWAIGSGEQSQDTGAFENDTVEAPAGTRSNASTASDAAVWIGELKAAGVPPNASAPTTSEMCNAYRLRLGVGPDRHRVSEDQIALDEEDSSDFAEETRLRQFSRQDEFDLDDDEFGYYQTEYERLYKQGQIDHYYDLKEVDEQAAKAFKSSLTYWDDETSSGEGLDVEEEEWEDESDQSEEYEDGSDADNDLNGNEL